MVNIKKHIIFLGFLLTFTMLLNVNGFSQTSKVQSVDINKVLNFTNADYNMGKIPFGKPSEYLITIKNISNDSVTLKNVAPQCGCTTPKYKVGEVILPGASTTVTLGFNGSSKGAFTKYATITFGNGMIKGVKFNGETYTQ